MPSYRVLKKGFFGGRIYDPSGKRPILHTDSPFPKKGKVEQVPSWLERMKDETSAQKKARVKSEQAAKKAEQEKADADQKDIEGATFLGKGGAPERVEAGGEVLGK